MSYIIKPYFFAPKVNNPNIFYDNSHGVFYKGCNFDCKFCVVKDLEKRYIDYTAIEIKQILSSLVKEYNKFKFTGGEPTLNVNLLRDLTICKSVGGDIFLDTNGSRPEIIETALQQNLINTLGIGLKGLDEEEAVNNANIKNTRLAYSQVIKTMKLNKKYTGTTFILTYVVSNQFSHQKLEEMANYFEYTDNVLLKLNSLFHEDKLEGYQKCDDDEIIKEIQKFITRNPEWKNKVIYVPGPDAVSDFEAIKFY